MAPSLPTTVAPGLLAPVIALNIWTFGMEIWMYMTRIPAITKYKVPIHPAMTKADLDKPLPADVRWKADNFNHLFEQPTQFYAIAITLAILKGGSKVEGAEMGGWDVDTVLAWTYVGLRVVHSLIQCLGNNVWRRFQVFVVTSCILFGMTVRAGLLVL